MNKVFISLLLFFSLKISSSAQTVNLVPPATIKDDSNTVYTIVQQMPEYPLGRDSLFAFIDKNLERPEGFIDATVYISFIVSKTGKLTGFKMARGVDAPLDSAAMKCIRSMVDWKPGMQNGHAVNVAMTLPFRFKKNGNVFTKTH
jgi:protein TonB